MQQHGEHARELSVARVAFVVLSSGFTFLDADPPTPFDVSLGNGFFELKK